MDAVDVKVLALAVLFDGEHVLRGQVLAEADGPKAPTSTRVVGIVVTTPEVVVVSVNSQHFL